MVVQYCVYERTMTVKYKNKNKISYSEKDTKMYAEIRRGVNEELYKNKMPVVDFCGNAPTRFSELNREKYVPHTKEDTETVYQIWNNNTMIFSSHSSYQRDETFSAISLYADSCSLPYTHNKREKEEISNIDLKPTLDYNMIIPYNFVNSVGSHEDNITATEDNPMIQVRGYANDLLIGVGNKHAITLDTRFSLYRNSAQIEFKIKWDAPIKSTKANIEKHLVDIPEILLATIMDKMETILTNNNWIINEDETTIDCVTQSNINTKAACSPAVISSLKKTKAEL